MVGEAREDPEQDVRALRAKDERAWRALHDREFPFLYRFALAMGASPDLAEDCASEALVRLVTRFPTLKLETAAATRAWLVVVCRNYLRDQIRKRRGEPLEAAYAHMVEDDPLVRVAIATALSGLPESQREVVVMRFLLDMTTREVAAASGKGVKAVESLQHRALETLRRSGALGAGKA